MRDYKLLGLRTKEDEKFCNFMVLVQSAAKKKKGKFFLDVGDNHEKETDILSLSDLYGWLIPDNLISDFEKIYFNDEEIPELWNSYYVCEIWAEKKKNISISFL